MGTKSKDKLWTSMYILLSLVNLLSNLGFSMMLTTISVYSVSCGASLAVAGTIASIFSFAALLTRPISGFIVDRYNKKTTFIISYFFFGAIVYGFAFVDSIAMLFVLRIIQGILFGISSTCSMALVSRALPRSRIGEGLGYFNAGMMVGQAIGPAIAVMLRDTIGFQWMYIIVATSICLPPLLFFFAKAPQGVQLQPSKDGVQKKPPFRLSGFIGKQFIVYALVCGMFSFYNGITNNLMLFIGEERAIDNISLFFTVSSVVLLLVRIMAGKVADRKSLTLLVNGALICSAISMFFIGKGNVLPVILAAAVLKALGQGFGHVSLQSEALKKADPMHVGVAASTMLIGNDIGNTLGPIVGGVVSQWADYFAVFVVSIALVVVAFIGFNIYQKKIGYQKPNISE